LPVGFLHPLKVAMQNGGGEDGKNPVSHARRPCTVISRFLNKHDRAKKLDLNPQNGPYFCDQPGSL
jgi:hypothetical protein